jgi:ArsR family transcriptional regulator
MYQKIFKLHSDLLRAVSHPKRLEIIHLLRNRQLCVNDIGEMLGLPQANLSQHLTILRDAKVVKTRREGKKVIYKISHNNFIKASDLMRDILIERYKNTNLADEFSLKMSDLVPLTKDPVCKMRLSPKTAAYATVHKNTNYFFCAKGCLDKFNKNPNKYE